jgi:hypothetical protein
MNACACAILATAFLVSGCSATPYKSYGARGGFQEKKLSENRFFVRYEVNGHATKLTLQSYWLYRAAQVTLENGYDGFAIAPDPVIHAHPLNHTLLTSQDAGLPHKLQMSSHLISVGTGYAPSMAGEIQLLKAPLTADPPRVLNARVVVAALQPVIEGAKCARENVCVHDSSYLGTR